MELYYIEYLKFFLIIFEISIFILVTKMGQDYKEQPLNHDDWIYTPGYPVVSISNIGKELVTFEQSLFALDATIYPEKYRIKGLDF